MVSISEDTMRLLLMQILNGERKNIRSGAKNDQMMVTDIIKIINDTEKTMRYSE